MTTERTRDVMFMAMTSLAGLVSGMLTAAISDGHLSNDLGLPFGLIVAFVLATSGTFPLGKALFLFGLISGTFPFAWSLAIMVELAAATRLGLTPDIGFPISIFLAGMTGSFIILSGALFLAQPLMRLKSILRTAFYWSLLAGTLSPVAWALGPSWGMWVASALHAVGIHIPIGMHSGKEYWDEPERASDRLFALFVLWQTTVAGIIGFSLRPSQVKFFSEQN